MDDFKSQVLQWDYVTVPMKYPRSLLGQTSLTSSEMSQVLMHTIEPFPTREDTGRLVKIFVNAYAKADLEQVASNITHLNSEVLDTVLMAL